mmetsp:Transcript_31348/g.63710  ORF Transcript_31348/g.63710 Transcript_31348/m.63710 type:complete len:352 (+) Transcript_31348:276-1331(+)
MQIGMATASAIRRKPTESIHGVLQRRSDSSVVSAAQDDFRIHRPNRDNICSTTSETSINPDTKWYTDIQPAVAAVASKLSRQTIPSKYNLNKSTEQNYKSRDHSFYGPFASLRKSLDYEYHYNYTRERQCVQDEILRKMYGDSLHTASNPSKEQGEQWIVFTAGPMGAGKGYTLQRLSETNRFPLDDFVLVDLDEIRRELPEYPYHASSNPATAGNRTRKEAGFVSEIATLASLRAGRNVVADGSLRAYRWYREYFALLRKEFPRLRIAIIYITAPKSAILHNAADRAMHTGRYVPIQTLEKVMRQVPRSMKVLAPLTDYFVTFFNSPANADLEILNDENWKNFEQMWQRP